MQTPPLLWVCIGKGGEGGLLGRSFLSKVNHVTYRWSDANGREVTVNLFLFSLSNLCECDIFFKSFSFHVQSYEHSFSRRRNFLTATYQTPDGHKYLKALHHNDHLGITCLDTCMDNNPRNPWWDGVPDLKWWCMVSQFLSTSRNSAVTLVPTKRQGKYLYSNSQTMHRLVCVMQFMYELFQVPAVPILPHPMEGLDMTCMEAAEDTLSPRNQEGKST